MDGASAMTTFTRIMAPLARPGLVTAALLTGLALWNETLLALVFITENSKHTLPQALLGLYGTMQYTSNWGGLFAGIIIVVIPTIALYALLGEVARARGAAFVEGPAPVLAGLACERADDGHLMLALTAPLEGAATVAELEALTGGRIAQWEVDGF